MKTKDCYTELAIQIATLDMKLNKILELLNSPDIEVISLGKGIPTDEDFSEEFK